MSHCPKCGYMRIAGPFYKLTDAGEALQYTCMQCGYSSFTQTLDSQKGIENFENKERETK